MVAGTLLNLYLGLIGHVDFIGFGLVVGLFALPFVVVAKILMIARAWDGFLHHAIAGAIVGFAAGLLFLGVRLPVEATAFSAAGVAGSLTYLVARNLLRKGMGW